MRCINHSGISIVSNTIVKSRVRIFVRIYVSKNIFKKNIIFREYLHRKYYGEYYILGILYVLHLSISSLYFCTFNSPIYA